MGKNILNHHLKTCLHILQFLFRWVVGARWMQPDSLLGCLEGFSSLSMFPSEAATLSQLAQG